MVVLTGESSNQLFRVFEDWERLLAPLDLKDLRCGRDNPSL